MERLKDFNHHLFDTTRQISPLIKAGTCAIPLSVLATGCTSTQEIGGAIGTIIISTCLLFLYGGIKTLGRNNKK